ncbi:MAG: 2-hydroxychromene-2-carboxylate isomerase [Gammaproteobacteria bacterium]|jgi:2-hydroxychromene-2-carboxylate isomerase|nr:2-hydroxychromene-2-carboxylate isomerase [Gammaproteobacteria bacterium]GIT47864.1 MAG: 2-hydroxychromene-2-carboxylate isomerase [Gammaproteobacteria bacterium]|tara:strand:- start:61 stop:651 length:591 start_codon:yes stop_codon:yes gene_type:complete
MSKSVEFFFDVGSPTVYLAATQLSKIAGRHGATVLWRPFLLGGVFKATGNVSPATVPAKSRYMGDDLERFARRYEVPFLFNPFFPVNTLALMRGAVAYQQQGRLDQYIEAIFSAMWVTGKNMNEPTIVAEVLDTIGIGAQEFLVAIAAQDVKDKLKSNTEEAVERGAFGAPTFFVGDEMFFGQDRLDFVEAALAAD